MRRRAPALTLVELLITAAVIALVAAFIIPTYQLILSQAQLSAATNQAVELLRLQQQRTVAEQVIYGFSSSATSTIVTYKKCSNVACTTTTNQSYTVDASTIATFLCRSANCDTKDVTLTTLPVNVLVDSASFGGQVDVRFTTAGAPSTSGTLVLRDAIRNRRRSIDLRPSGSLLPGSREY